MALLSKGWKAAGAVVVVSVLSLIMIVGNLTKEGRLSLMIIYGIGAIAGLLASTIAFILIRRKAANLRAKNLLITLGTLFGGAGLLSINAVSEPLIGQKTADTGILILNYALGYFMIGVSIDALRVLMAGKAGKTKK